MNDCKAFTDFLLRRVPEYDKQIIEDFKPQEDEWVGKFTWGVEPPFWWECREAVRKLSEGMHYRKSRKPPRQSPWVGHAALMFDRMELSWPKYVSHDWIPAAPGFSVDKPCDPTPNPLKSPSL